MHVGEHCCFAGTEVEDRTEGGTRGLFEAEARPALEERPELWGPRGCGRSYPAFVRAAGLVQSRSFHVRAENWLTGRQVEGEARSFTSASCSHTPAQDPLCVQACAPPVPLWCRLSRSDTSALAKRDMCVCTKKRLCEAAGWEVGVSRGSSLLSQQACAWFGSRASCAYRQWGKLSMRQMFHTCIAMLTGKQELQLAAYVMVSASL